MPYYDKENIKKLREIDLLTYLRNYEPDNLVKINKNNYTTKEHDSLKISNGLWHWFSRDIGGKSAIDYLIHVKGNTFLEAIEILQQKSDISFSSPVLRKSKQQFNRLILPKRYKDNEHVINYLTRRGIDKKIVLECIDNNLIYEDVNNNAVFVGFDKDGIERYAFVRGTNDSRFMKDVYGSHKAFSFKLDSINECNEVHLFESAIDLLSYASLNKNYYETNLLSLAGVYSPSKKLEDSKIPLALAYYLNQKPNIKKIYLHLDNDVAGRNSSEALAYVLKNKYVVIDDPPKNGKDYNDYLNILRSKKTRYIDNFER